MHFIKENTYTTNIIFKTYIIKETMFLIVYSYKCKKRLPLTYIRLTNRANTDWKTTFTVCNGGR